MRTPFRFRRMFTNLAGPVTVTVLLLAAGCEGGPGGLFADWQPPGAASSLDQQHISYRERYQTERDPDALRWLLAHRIQQGMTVGDVNEALGQEGEREFDDLHLKTKGGSYRASDVAYRWGPDSRGRSVYLFFRDGRLVNFRPGEYVE